MIGRNVGRRTPFPQLRMGCLQHNPVILRHEFQKLNRFANKYFEQEISVDFIPSLINYSAYRL
jgi:hypothetical protein